MLKLTLKPGEFISIGENVRVVFSGGSANNVHLLVDAPKEVNIVRSNAKNAGSETRQEGIAEKKRKNPYYKEKGISDAAKREIAQILKRENYGK